MTIAPLYINVANFYFVQPRPCRPFSEGIQITREILRGIGFSTAIWKPKYMNAIISISQLSKSLQEITLNYNIKNVHKIIRVSCFLFIDINFDVPRCSIDEIYGGLFFIHELQSSKPWPTFTKFILARNKLDIRKKKPILMYRVNHIIFSRSWYRSLILAMNQKS